MKNKILRNVNSFFKSQKAITGWKALNITHSSNLYKAMIIRNLHTGHMNTPRQPPNHRFSDTKHGSPHSH